ncbi:hypothetical protein WMY93_004789 [Mugilogobius chulae]|uniref:Refilin A n=1 Tax=Mugilogobius chulae TaxID=88201 RepID=A0AAW0PS83_9GOBI
MEGIRGAVRVTGHKSALRKDKSQRRHRAAPQTHECQSAPKRLRVGVYAYIGFPPPCELERIHAESGEEPTVNALKTIHPPALTTNASLVLWEASAQSYSDSVYIGPTRLERRGVRAPHFPLAAERGDAPAAPGGWTGASGRRKPGRIIRRELSRRDTYTVIRSQSKPAEQRSTLRDRCQTRGLLSDASIGAGRLQKTLERVDRSPRTPVNVNSSPLVSLLIFTHHFGLLCVRTSARNYRRVVFTPLCIEPFQKWWGICIYKRWMKVSKERTGKGCSTVRIRAYLRVPVRLSAPCPRGSSNLAPAAARRPTTTNTNTTTHTTKRRAKLLPYLLLNSSDTRTRMHPVFYGESIEVNPTSEKEIKCSSEVKYDSDRHYRDQVYCAPVPTPTGFSETVVAVPNCTWRSYKSQVYLEPRQKPLSYRSTTIIYPKHAKSTYRTTLNYNATGSRRWFVSTVQLESSEDSSPCVIYTEDL